MPASRSSRLTALLCHCLITLTLWLAALTGPALAGEKYILPEDSEVALGRSMEYLPDTGNRFTAVEAQAQPGWRPLAQDALSLGYLRYPVWLRTRLHNPGDQPLQRLLEVGNPVLDRLEIWMTPVGGPVRYWHLGDKQPFRDRPLAHRNYLIPAELPARSETTLLMRLETTSAMQANITLWQPDRFRSVDETHLLVQGLYFGIMISMLLYNGFLFASLRERQYAWYGAYVTSISVFLACLDGLSFQYLWPDATHWNDKALVISLAATLFFGGLFARDFLHLRSAGRLVNHLLNLAVFYTLLCMGAGLTTDYMFAIHMTEAGAMAVIPIMFYVAIQRALQGYQPARFYIAAWSSVLISGLVLAMDKYGLIAHTAFTVVAVPLGSAVQILLLSFALGDQMQRERRLREQAHADMLRIQQENNTVLERKVQERNAELIEAVRKLRELTVTDALTGVFNRRHFDEVLRHEVKRAARSNDWLGLMILDADHFKSVNDTWGHQTGDVCLQTIARVLRDQVSRECDVVARFGGEEFCLVLPSTDPEGVQLIAERVRAALEQTVINGPREPFRITASIGAVCVIPTDLDDGLRLLSTADAALYMAKAGGRNRVCMRDSLD